MAETPADWRLLEVGLGGRSTPPTSSTGRGSPSSPRCRSTTRVLGDTLAGIAREKADILKRRVRWWCAGRPPRRSPRIGPAPGRLRAPLVHRPTTTGRRGASPAAWSSRRGGLLDLPRRTLGAHQFGQRRRSSIAGCRGRSGLDAAAWSRGRCGADMAGPAAAAAAGRAHRGFRPGRRALARWRSQPGAGEALAEAMARACRRGRCTSSCGMLATKDVEGFLRPLAAEARDLAAVAPIPGEAGNAPPPRRPPPPPAPPASPPGRAKRRRGRTGPPSPPATPAPRSLICGSLYLAGRVLRDNG